MDQTVERMISLQALDAPALPPGIQVLRAAYRRQVPAHYHGNPHTRELVSLNLLMVPDGRLVIPRIPQASFVDFYRQLGIENPALMQRIISPSGTAKSAASHYVTPIKEISGMCLSGFSLPGDAQGYGWDVLQAEAGGQGLELTVLFQGNGLYYNRGSVFFNGEHLLAYPDLFLAELLARDLPDQVREQVAVSERSLKRNLLFFVVMPDGRMSPHLHRFTESETYLQGMARLQDDFRQQQVHCALAASPPLVIPGAGHTPVYLSLEEILRDYHANDVRHSLYCPYDGTVLLSGELGRAQCLQPEHLAASIALENCKPVLVPLAETMGFHTRGEIGFILAGELEAVLARKGYAGRYTVELVEDGRLALSILPLEGVYSHLLPFLTRSGMFGLIQTSGTHGNITGNDGPTLRQLTAILRDLNCQPPFDTDPIIAVASGSQGNDVPNILCRGRDGQPELLATLVPAASLDDQPAPRGIVTTPRVGIAVPQVR